MDSPRSNSEQMQPSPAVNTMGPLDQVESQIDRAARQGAAGSLEVSGAYCPISEPPT